MLPEQVLAVTLLRAGPPRLQGVPPIATLSVGLQTCVISA